jgi:hypothetical protein
VSSIQPAQLERSHSDAWAQSHDKTRHRCRRHWPPPAASSTRSSSLRSGVATPSSTLRAAAADARIVKSADRSAVRLCDAAGEEEEGSTSAARTSACHSSVVQAAVQLQNSIEHSNFFILDT